MNQENYFHTRKGLHAFLHCAKCDGAVTHKVTKYPSHWAVESAFDEDNMMRDAYWNTCRGIAEAINHLIGQPEPVEECEKGSTTKGGKLQ